MANSKHAHLRYTILDRCFRRKRHPFSFQELLEKVNAKICEIYPGESIETRTLRQDINIFRDKETGFGAPLETVKNCGKSTFLYKNKKIGELFDTENGQFKDISVCNAIFSITKMEGFKNRK